eukprot:TRINITY_DN7611_c1_g1_i1.p2 TRINITY_DN7611_c1_g1~~TRINITY_DN7611_c1_g1_i1.p2  ORF type:complete len:310 (+),score=103.76 TRINITY_DN7611_c1_g1_i1:54-983(+)
MATERKQGTAFSLNHKNKLRIDEEKAKEEAASNPLARPLPRRVDSHEHPIVFLAFSDGGVPLGKVVIELFDDVSPMAAENFRCLCTGEAGTGNSGAKLHFKGTPVHHIGDGYVGGGDIVASDGTGGDSIFGRRFQIENYKMTHTGEGVVSMIATKNLLNVSSQFSISLKALPELNNKNAVVGRVLDGMDVVKKLAGYSHVDGAPLNMLTVSDCGELNRAQRKSHAFLEREREMKEKDRAEARKELEDEKTRRFDDDDDALLAIKNKLKCTKRKAKVIDVGQDEDEEELDWIKQKNSAKQITTKKRRKFF